MYIKVINKELKKYSIIPKYYGRWAGNFHEQSDETHTKEGFIKVIEPVINSDEYYGQVLHLENGSYIFEILKADIITIVDIRNNKIEEFNHIFDDFTTLINRCELLNRRRSTEEINKLNVVIDICLDAKESYINYINNESDINKLSNFSVKSDDVIKMKQLFKPFE